jgi:hypothetical protein
MKLLIGTLLSLLLCSYCYGQDRQVTVRAEGEIVGGNTLGARQQALIQAFRQAVEEGLGTLIESSTIVQNAAVISDNIYAKSQGYVKTHEVLNEGVEAESSTYFVEVRATVNLTEMGTDLRALGILKDMMGNPKILSLIQEVSTRSGQTSMIDESAASIAVEEALREHHFELVDREQVNKIRADEMARMGDLLLNRLMDDPDAISRMAKRAQEYGAQYLLLGSSLIESETTSGTAHRSNATFKCRVVDAATGEKVALTQKAESGKGKDRNSADMYAGQRAGRIAAEDIIPQIAQNWSRRANEGIAYVVKLYGVKSYGKQGRRFINALKGFPGVTQCTRRMWDARMGRLEVDVAFKGGTADDLLDGIFELAEGIPGMENLDLEEQTGNNMNFRIK